jgi:general secretion pathway protein L
MRLFVCPAAPSDRDAEGRAHLRSASWVALDEGEVRSQGTGNAAPLSDLAGSPTLADPANVVLIVPAEHCLSLKCTPPASGAGQMRRALPFLVEEYLASDLDDVHLAHGPIRRREPVDVTVIDSALLRGWVDALTGLGLTPGYAVADTALLPRERNGITVLRDGSRALVHAPSQWLAVDAAAIATAVAAALETMPADEEVTIDLVNGDLSAIERAHLEQGRAAAILWRVEETDVPALTYLARAFSPANVTVNLLSGSFAPPRRRNETLSRWRGVAVLAGVWLALALVSMAAKGFWADRRADALAGEAEALYREYFPGDRRIQDVYRQMSTHIGARTGGEGDALALIGELAQAAGPASGAQVRSLMYYGDRVELNAEVAVQGFDALDRIKSALNGRGIEVEITSAEQQDQGVLARLRIRGTS